MNDNQHKLMATWAGDCAEHILAAFEDYYPGDNRPRSAIEGIRAWVKGNLTTAEVRKLAFEAHAAARDAIIPRSIAAARAAGHAAATAHVPDHARHAASYALKASVDPAAEREWQLQKCPQPVKSELTL